MSKTILSNSQVYHIYNRGVDKRNIVLYEKDHQRFVNSLIVFNTEENLNGKHFNEHLNCEHKDPLVNVLAYCLMPNHFHLLLEQLTNNGIEKFIHKLSTSYTMYFNKKYQRNGALLQGTFKRSHIKSDSRLVEISKYIHYNPYKILRVEGESIKDTEKRLIDYPWSSFQDYAGIRNGSAIINNNGMIIDQFATPEDYVKYVLG